SGPTCCHAPKLANVRRRRQAPPGSRPPTARRTLRSRWHGSWTPERDRQYRRGAQHMPVGTAREPGTSARDFFPSRRTLPSLRSAAAECRGCPLWKNATQTVFGEGVPKARLMLVGETPGDREDLEGRPFVGPAGRLLDDALVRAGIERNDAYGTYGAKHVNMGAAGHAR